MQAIHIFTSITANYVPKARVLATSVKRFHPDAQFHLVLSDVIPESLVIESEPFDSIITIQELPIPELKSWIFKHSLVEMCTGVKGFAFQELLRRYNCEKIFYFDPDIVILDRLDSLVEKLEQYSILLTPHQTIPEESNEAVIDNEICSLKHGVFNLGFLGIRNSEEGRRFLKWWSNRCLDFCYDDIPGGLFTDQRWVDLAPAFFTDLYVLREPIYNVATWNLTHRIATGNLEEGILINDERLCFYHFSGFDSGAQEIMLNRYGSASPILFDLRQWYIDRCAQSGQNEFGQLPCFYSYFDKGDLITKHQRLLYRQRVDLQQAFPNPFSTTDVNYSYFNWYAQHEQRETVNMQENSLEIPQALIQVQADLEQATSLIKAMESSKFWKLRTGWFRLKRLLGLTKEGQGVVRDDREVTPSELEPSLQQASLKQAQLQVVKDESINNTSGDVESLKREITWLRMEVEQYRKEDQHFNSEQPYVAGTNIISKIVPPIPPFALRATVSSPSMGGYLIVADAWYFVVNHFIKEDSTILDIGCGCGKTARLLLLNPYIKKYIGFDNYEKSIEWCQQNIYPFYNGRCEFYHIDVFSNAYNPSGKVIGTEVVFPADDDTVDFVFAASLFTHLFEDDTKHYLQEVKRVLKKDGTFLPSIHTSPDSGTFYSGSEVRIDVDTEYFISLAQAAGLHLVQKLGNLSGQEALMFKSSL